ncbi:MAG: hypothetical protein EOO63_08665, partial [Hymenobacter sp.]
MKWILLLLVGLLACHSQTQAPVSGAVWGSAVADQLYARHVLNQAGRDSLKSLITAGALSTSYEAPGSGISYPYRAVDPATVLAFCVEAFQNEEYYRAGLGSGYQSPTPAKLSAALRQTSGDTAAALRQLMPPATLLEMKIPAEDKVTQTGWTIYPPLGRSATLPHAIAATRSIYGKTRTRTARDLYELGLLTKIGYDSVSKALAGGQLRREIEVCQLAAQMALVSAVRPAQVQAFDSVLTRLQQAGVMPIAGLQQAQADAQLHRSFRLFDVLPYCAHARVLNLRTLPRAPEQLYTRLLAEVAAIWPAFRYAQVHIRRREQDLGSLVEELVELSFIASGRCYATEFTQGYRRKDGHEPNPAIGAKVGENFSTGINQWLRDQGRPERLHLAYTPDEQSVYGRERLGLIMLTTKQVTAWGPSSHLLSSESENTQFTSAYVEQALALYQQGGLLDHLAAAKVADGRRLALSGGIDSYIGLLHCFPGLLIEMGGEDAEEPQAYAKALYQVAAATRRAFRPTNVQDDFPGQQARNRNRRID